MKRLFLAAAVMASVCMSANAAKKDKAEPKEQLFGVKSGIITMSNENLSSFSGNGGGFGGGMGAGMMGGMGGMMGGMGGQRMGGQNAGTAQNGERAQRTQRSFDPSQIVTKIYFDDYGRKTATVTSRGEAGTTRSIVVDGATVTINVEENTATKMPQMGRQGSQQSSRMGGMMGGFGGGMGGQIKPAFDFENLDAKTIKKNKIQELGEEEVAGVMCKKYSVKVSNQGYTTNQTVWIYKNIQMKSQTESDWGTNTQAAAKIEEIDVPADMFTIPEGCEVTERQMRGMGGMGGMMGGGDFGGGAGMGGGFGGGMGGGMMMGGGMGGF